MAGSTLKGILVTNQHIQRAIGEFDQMYSTDTNAYDSWLDKNTYKWALWHNGRLYPQKYIMSLASGLQTSDFIAANARRVFVMLGFEVIRKP